jgi:predicted transcriptional regulator with HTH domain
MFEMDPSETTWYSSKEYATFTEEAALYSPEGGWQYVDSPKPRGFSMAENNPDACPILGKIGMLAKYVSYEEGGSPLRRIVCELIDRQISKHVVLSQELNKAIRNPRSKLKTGVKARISLHLPSSMGGIGHPRAQEDLWEVLSEVEKKILIYSSQQNPVETLIESISSRVERGIEPASVRTHLEGFISSINQEDIMTGDRIFEITKDKRFAEHKRYAENNDLLSLQTCLNKIMTNYMFLDSLKGKPKARNRGQIRRLRSQFRKLADASSEIEIPEKSPFRSLKACIANIVRSQADVYVPKQVYLDYIARLEFPSMQIFFSDPEG